MGYIRKLGLLLDKKAYRYLIWLVIFSVFLSFIETIGISAVLPFIDIATNFNTISSNQYYHWIFNYLGFEKNVNFAIFFGLVLFCFYIFRGAVNLLYSYAMAHFINSLYAQTTERLFDAYLKMPYQLFTNKNSSYLTKSIVREANLVSSVFAAICSIISESLIIIFLYILMLIVNWKITLIFTIILMAQLFFLTKKISKTIKKIGGTRAKIEAKYFEIINRLFGNYKHIKLQDENRLNSFKEDFSLAVNNYAKVNRTNTFLHSFPRLFMETSGFSIVILMLVALLYIEQSNIYHILPTLSLFVLALYRLLPSVNRIFSGYNALIFNYKAIDIIDEELQTTQENFGNKRILFEKNIKFLNLNFSFQDKQVLKNLNLTISKGESIAFVGESGSGKSTLVDLLIGLYQPNKGEIKIDNLLLDESNLKNWRSQIGYISQQTYLFDSTIAENVCFGRNLDINLLEKVLKQANIFDFLQTKQGFETLVGEGGIQLSGGQKQRVAIARELYGQPEILILDEATSALDEETEKKIMNEIYNICHDKTLIIVAHRLSTIKGCDRIFEIKSGNAIEQ